jgi:uncharacterized protein YraI
MKLFYKSLLATVVFMLFMVAAHAQGYHISSSTGANVRKGPGTDQPILAKIPQGSNVKVIERTNSNWVKVEYNGQTGYVASELVKEGSAPTRSNNSGNRSSSNSSGNRSSSNSNGNRQSSNNSSSNNRSSGSSASNYDKNIGLGLRFGDPTGITFKKYSGNTAWEVNLGSSYRWGYRYEDRFYRYDRFHDKKYYYYRGHDAGPTTALQIHWLKHHNLSNDGALQFYFGLGPQARFTNVHYRYKYDDRIYYERFTDVDLGIDGVIGLEYTIPGAPLSIFLDGNIFVEVFDAPGWIHGQSGLGIRYNFR